MGVQVGGEGRARSPTLAQFRDELDPDLLKDYSGVLGLAHNAANRLDTLQVALDHRADVHDAHAVAVVAVRTKDLRALA